MKTLPKRYARLIIIQSPTLKQMRQDGSFEARAAHNKSHHRPVRWTITSRREHKRHTRRGVTTISATRPCRLDGSGSGVAASRDNRDTVRRHRCVSRAKLAAYLANGGPNGGGRKGGRYAAIGNVRRDSSPVEATRWIGHDSFPCLVLARNISAEERGKRLSRRVKVPRGENMPCVSSYVNWLGVESTWLEIFFFQLFKE